MNIRPLRAPLEEVSPCGKVLDSLTVPLAGGPWQWHIPRPTVSGLGFRVQGLGFRVRKLCSINQEFGDFVQDTSSLVCYGDEIKPGNVLRPDKGHEQLCFYWSLQELPRWLLNLVCAGYLVCKANMAAKETCEKNVQRLCNLGLRALDA